MYAKKPALTPSERVCKGMNALDFAASRGKCPRNWRNLINLANLRLSQYDGSPLSQIFGDYHTGLAKLQAHLSFLEFGFQSLREPGDTELLKAEWRNSLKTEKTWSQTGLMYWRTIKGQTYLIYPIQNERSSWQISRNNPVMNFPAHYASLVSAKRRIRKETASA